MRLRPLSDRLLVRRVAKEEKTPGGLYIPDPSKELPQEGIVVAMGPECSGFTVGNRVLFGKYSGSEVKLGGENLTILRMDELFGVF